MKRKINLMKRVNDISDEEMQQLMDFDDLLLKQTRYQKRVRNKYIFWATSLLVVTGFIYWFSVSTFKKDSEIQTNTYFESENDGIEKMAPVEKPAVLVDSTLLKNDLPKVIVNKISEKSVANKPEAPAKQITITETKNVYIQAEPAQGYSNLYQYFNENLVYPSIALRDSIEGVMTISFVITEKGNVDKLTIIQSLGESFDNEAIRLVSKMPVWKPATLNGKPVASRISIPITFNIKKVISIDK